MKEEKNIQDTIRSTNIGESKISIFEKLIVGSGVLLFIGIIAYIILFALMCTI